MSAKVLLEPRKAFADSKGIRAVADMSSSPSDDLLQRSVNRVGVFALFLTIAAAAEFVVGDTLKWLFGAMPPPSELFWDRVGTGVVVSMSLAAFLLNRSRRLSLAILLRLGIGYLVFVVFAVSFTDHADGWWRGEHGLHGVPVACVLILAFPLIVPLSKAKTLAVATTMAVTGPISLWCVATVMDHPMPHAGAYVDVFAPQMIIALLALLPATIIHDLNMEVKRARRLGAYELTERLGQGGMGEVWRARHRLLARPAAVKLIRQEIAGDVGSESASRMAQRFEREAQAMASLRSPHTVELYDFGTTSDGLLYYVMEMLDGFDVETLIERYGPQPPERVVAWLGQICHSLREAHEDGLVHRDIKPANLFICRYGSDYDFVKVLDFGLVALQPALAAEDARLSVEDSIRGTPAYMAPELVTGSSTPDAQADVYALGCVAYWSLTGRPVFEGNTPIEVIIGHVDKTPVPPSQLSAYEISADLEGILLACLEKNPADRPAGMEDLAARLKACRFEEPWDRERAKQWWERHQPLEQ